jgi:hypothetical protein
MLVGGTYGLFVGSLFDVYDAGATETALGPQSLRRGSGRRSWLT